MLPKPLKVLVLGPDRNDPGGVANYYNAVLPWLPVETIRTEYLEIGSTKGKQNPFYLFTDQLRLWRAIGSMNPDIVHINPSLDPKGFIRDGLFLLITRLRKRPTIVFFRGWQVPFEDTVTRRFMWYFRTTYGKAGSFIVLAQSFADRLRGWGIEAPIHLGTTAVPNQLIENYSVDAKATEIASTDVLKLLYLARLERDKGILELLGAVQSLIRRGRPVTLTIAGDGLVMSEVRVRVAAMGADARKIRIIGYVRGDQKAHVFREHHVFCFPTQYGEGMPNALLEAMGFGLAVVTCPVGGIADFFDAEKMGALLESQDPSEIERRIDGLIDDRGRLARIARFNHEFACTHFLASIAAKFLEARYTDLMESQITPNAAGTSSISYRSDSTSQ